MSAHIWFSTYYGTYMTSHIWSHIYDWKLSSYIGTLILMHTYDCTYMTSHIWPQIYDHTYMTQACSHVYIGSPILLTHMTARIWLHIYEDTYMTLQIIIYLQKILHVYDTHIWGQLKDHIRTLYDHMCTYMICTYMISCWYMIHIYEYSDIWYTYMIRFLRPANIFRNFKVSVHIWNNDHLRVVG